MTSFLDDPLNASSIEFLECNVREQGLLDKKMKIEHTQDQPLKMIFYNINMP